MKRLVALMMCAVSLGAAAQFPNLPYNPDDNADGLIGVADLQTLLANYGQEFSSAVVSEDGESAIVYMELLGYFECEYACEQLPGFWQMPRPKDLVPVFSELNTGACCTSVWVSFEGINTNNFNPGKWPVYQHSPLETQIEISQAAPGYLNHCYCAAKQLPRVEYDYCRVDDMNNDGAHSQLKTCINSKLQDGWQLFGSSRDGEDFSVLIQAFWRWAE